MNTYPPPLAPPGPASAATAGAAVFAVLVLPAVVPLIRIFVPYMTVFGRTVLTSSPRQRSRTAFPPEAEPEYAQRSYFFGPAMRDVRAITTEGLRGMRQKARDMYRRVSDLLTVHYTNRTGRWWVTPFAIAEYAYITLGLALALALGALLGGLEAGGILAAQFAVRTGSRLLRTLDTALLRAKGLNGMLCPSCYHRVAYPAYKCPTCDHLHADVRPGRHGMLRRRCACDGGGKPMRTLIILGSHRLPAFCTNCGESMSEAVGRSRELVLPLFGGVAAGKTQLMAAMTMGLVQDSARRASPADEATRRAYAVMKEVFDHKREFRKTGEELPRAHTLHTGSGRSRRLVHLFDTGGERFTDRDRIQELSYAEYARTFLFVVDVQAVPQFWKQLSPEEAERLDPTTASGTAPTVVFQQTVQTLMEMGVPLRRSRLIVAISKTDLIDELTIATGRRTGNAWAKAWLTSTLGLGNLVRSMRDQFARVDYVFTTAVPDDSGRLPASIRAVTSGWLDSDRLTSFRAIPLPRFRFRT